MTSIKIRDVHRHSVYVNGGSIDPTREFVAGVAYVFDSCTGHPPVPSSQAATA